MMRYRSARIAPGVKPPTSIESEEASRPTTEEEEGPRPRRTAASATDGVARFVGICESEEEETALPHDWQKRDSSGISAEQVRQRITWGNAIAREVARRREQGAGEEAGSGEQEAGSGLGAVDNSQLTVTRL